MPKSSSSTASQANDRSKAKRHTHVVRKGGVVNNPDKPKKEA